MLLQNFIVNKMKCQEIWDSISYNVKLSTHFCEILLPSHEKSVLHVKWRKYLESSRRDWHVASYSIKLMAAQSAWVWEFVFKKMTKKTLFLILVKINEANYEKTIIIDKNLI